MAESIQKFIADYSVIMLVITMIFAILQCFLGYRLLKVWVAIIGFIIGFLLGLIITMAVGSNIPAWLPFVIGIGAGIVMALVAYKLYLVGVFIYAALLVFGLVYQIPVSGKNWQIVLLVAAIAAGIAAGILAVRFSRPLIILFSAVGGAGNFTVALAGLVPAISSNQIAFWGILAAMALVGFIIQMTTTRGIDHRNTGK